MEQEKSSILFKGLGCISLVPFISLLHRYRNMSDTECNLSFGTTKKLDYDMHIFLEFLASIDMHGATCLKIFR